MLPFRRSPLVAIFTAGLLACGGSALAPPEDGGSDIATTADAGIPDHTDGPVVVADASPSDASVTNDSSVYSDSPGNADSPENGDSAPPVDAGVDAPPPPILVQANPPPGVAVDGQYIFWADWGAQGGGGCPQGCASIWRADLDGTNVTLVVQDFATLAFPEDVVLYGDSVYWDNSGSSSAGLPPVARCPKTGCAGPAEALATVGPFVYGSGLAIGDPGFFWVGEHGSPPLGGLWRVQPADAGASGEIVTNNGTIGPAGGIALDNDRVYFSMPVLASSPASTVASIAADAALIPLDASASSFAQLARLASGDAGFFWNDTDAPNLFVDDTSIYYAWGAGDVVGALPKTGVAEAGVAPVYAWNVGGAMRIVADANYVYWTVRGPNTNQSGNTLVYSDGSIMKCPKTGCSASGPTVMATGLDQLSGFLTVDASYVYFTQFGDGTIRRILK